MRKLRKFAAMASAIVIGACAVAPMAMNSFAVDPVSSFTLNIPTGSGVDSLSNVTAYKIFGISVQNDGSYKTDETTWTSDTIKNAITGYSALSLSDTSTPKDALTAISGLNQAQADELAKAIANAIVAANKAAANTVTGTTLTKVGGTGDDKDKYKFGDAAPTNGYYIVLADGVRNNGEGTADDETTQSLGMLSVIDGSVDYIGKDPGNAKVGLPTVEKKVYEDDSAHALGDGNKATYETDGQWNDVADLEIGQEAKFRLYGTLPANYDDYTSYKYWFEDTLGVEFEKPTVTPTSAFTVKYYDRAADVADPSKGTTIDVTPTITDITSGETVTGYKIQIGWNNLKSITGITKDSVIVVEYTTKLTDKAIVASTGGQLNKVKLEYSNNPNQRADGDTSTTPDDTVIVYTYDLTVDKKFFAGSSLTETEIKNGTYSDFVFNLYAANGTTKIKVKPCTDDDNYDYVIDNSADATNENMTLSVYNSSGKRVDTTVEGWNTNVSGMTLKIKIKGVDSQVYKIGENQEGRTSGQKYNDVAQKNATVTVTDSTIYVQNFDGTNKCLTYTVGDGTNNALHQIDILNESGVKLPSTGGIGTTIFYVGGGAMVAVAGIFLITKKRMKKEN